MMHQVWPLLSFALLGLFISQTAADPRVIFSLNATTVTIGSTVTLSCNLEEYSTLSGIFYVNFFRDNFTDFGGYFAAYYVSTSSGKPQTTKFDPNRILLGATYQPLSSTFPLYQISLTPTDALKHTYYCHLHKDPKELDVLSNRVDLIVGKTQPEPSTTPSPPTVQPTVPGTKPEVTFSTNATSVKVGETIKLRCKLSHFVPPEDREFYVNFYQDNDKHHIGYFRSGAPVQGRRNTVFYNDDFFSNLTFHPVSWAFPVYEITLTHLTPGSHNYYCNLRNTNLNLDIYSNHGAVAVTPSSSSSPLAVISTEDTTPTLGHPFTLTCTLSHFNPIPANYLVKFHSFFDDQLATFEVVNGKALLEDVINEKADVSVGNRSTYPTFDLQVTEKVRVDSSYWCTVEERGRELVKSNYYPVFVHFTASSPAPDQRYGTCGLGGPTPLDLSKQQYSVQFLTDLGPKSVNLLAEYIVKPNLAVELKTANVAPWSNIHHGHDTAFPSFQIWATGTASMKGSWWCLLVQGTPGSSDYREFRSNKEGL